MVHIAVNADEVSFISAGYEDFLTRSTTIGRENRNPARAGFLSRRRDILGLLAG
jgi:hypothetical protein